MPTTRKRALIQFIGSEPVRFVESDEAVATDWNDERERDLGVVLAATKAYVKELEALAVGRYAHVRHLVPEYMANPGNIVVAACSDGYVIRYERRATEERRIAGFVTPDDVGRAVTLISQNLVHIQESDGARPDPTSFGVEMTLRTANADGSNTQELFSVRLGFEASAAQPASPDSFGARPYRQLAVRSEIEMQLHGELAPPADGSTPTPFVTSTLIRLPVGWDCIEVYPGAQSSHWLVESASLWAERDLLGAVVVAQSRQAAQASLDPRAATRKVYAGLLSSFRALLDSEPTREQSLQAFLQANPALLCPTHIRIWPKLQFGAAVSDFVLQDANQEYILVELERSTQTLFRQDGHPTADLTHALGQVLDWKRYIEDNLSTVQRELGLSGMTATSHGLVVMGRRQSLSQKDSRKLQAMAAESPRLRVATYDDIYDRAQAAIENLLGPIWDPGGSTSVVYPWSGLNMQTSSPQTEA
jgi:hypothetical protein